MFGNLGEKVQKRLPEGSFMRNVVTLMSGTVFAQLLTILASPILTRIFTPGDYGIYALYASILGIFGVVVCLCYELAIVLPEEDDAAASLLVLSVLISLGMAAFTLLLVTFGGNLFSNLLGVPELAQWLWFLPVSLIASGLFKAFNYWSTRRKQFKLLAKRQITQSSVSITTQFTLGGIFHAGPWGLISGSILGDVIATLRLAWATWVQDNRYLIKAFNLKTLKFNAGKYKRFPLYLSAAGLMNTSSSEIPVILIGYYFDPTIVGYYLLGRRLVEMPLSVVQGAVAKVFFPRATEAHRNGNLDAIVLEAFLSLFSFILVPILLLIIAGPDLIAIVFGGAWRIAGVFLIWMAPRILAQFISSPLASVFLILQRQDLNLKIDSLLFISNIGLVIVGGLLNNYLLAIQMLGIGNFILYSIACLFIFMVSEISLMEILRKIIHSFGRAVPYLILPLLSLILIKQGEVTVILAVISGCLFLIFNARDFSAIR